MRKTFLLAILLATFLQTPGYAGDKGQSGAEPEFIKASFSQDKADNYKPDDWITGLTIYSLIIGVYAIYWFRQKA